MVATPSVLPVSTDYPREYRGGFHPHLPVFKLASLVTYRQPQRVSGHTASLYVPLPKLCLTYRLTKYQDRCPLAYCHGRGFVVGSRLDSDATTRILMTAITSMPTRLSVASVVIRLRICAYAFTTLKTLPLPNPQQWIKTTHDARIAVLIYAPCFSAFKVAHSCEWAVKN